MSLNPPVISILMPVYNGGKYLRPAIDSMLCQTERNFELLILNDGSTDNTQAVVESFHDERIIAVNNAVNQGLIATLNQGIKLARGTFIARMDQDDLASPERLEKELRFLEANPDICAVATRIMLMDETGKETGFWNDDKLAVTVEQICRRMPEENCIAHPTILIRSEVLRKYGYHKDQKGSEDWDLWMRLLTDGNKIAKINEVLLHYRIHPASITMQHNREGVYLKKSKVQMTFCLNRIKTLHLNAFDRRVLKGAVLNYFKYILQKLHPGAVSSLKTIFGTNPFSAAKQYNRMVRETRSCVKKGTQTFFFFPYTHLGGAEKVHSQIVEALSDAKPLVFITDKSSEKGLLETFKKHSTLLEISLIAGYPILHRKVKKTLTKLTSSAAKPVYFGSNSYFYYHLLPYLAPGSRCMDLMHGFSHPGEPGPEYASLPVVNLLYRRVVITQKGKADFRLIYSQNQIDPTLLERLTYIPNYTYIPEKAVQKKNEELRIIYVGRSTTEKRVYLFGEIARKLHEQGINATCLLAGPAPGSILASDESHCTLLGEIQNEQELRNLYASADILLLTSSREGFPLVIMEAMAQGVVCVCTDVGGISEHLIQKKTGMLVSTSGTEESIVEQFASIISGLDKERALLSTMSANSSEYARTHFGKTLFVDSYRKLLGKESNS
jgi:glycosyltransferase involved in cell wall biosynthesis